jgi:hypothetical protein
VQVKPSVGVRLDTVIRTVGDDGAGAGERFRDVFTLREDRAGGESAL